MIIRNEQAVTDAKTELQEARDFEVLQKKLEQSHELQLKKIDLEVARKETQSKERYKSIERIAIALIKLPVLPIVLIIAGVLWIRDGDLPADLDDFLDL